MGLDRTDGWTDERRPLLSLRRFGHLVYVYINLFLMFHYIVLNIIYICVCAIFVDIIICVLFVGRFSYM
jgi:hypothetical protein